MPMTILFFSFLALVFLHELETTLNKTGEIKWAKVLRFPIARKSFPTIAGLIVLAVLFLFEIKLYSDGQIYAHGDKFLPLIRAALILLLCFFAVAYRATVLHAKALRSMPSTVSIQKLVIVLAGVVTFVVFLIMQFKLIF